MQIRAVERDFGGAWFGIERSTSPIVVSLIRSHTGLEQQIGGTSVIPDDKNDVALLSAGTSRKFCHVNSARPEGWIIRSGNMKSIWVLPVALDQSGGGIDNWHRLGQTMSGNGRHHSLHRSPAVPTDPQHFYAVGWFLGIHIQFDIFAAIYTHGRCVSFDFSIRCRISKLKGSNRLARTLHFAAVWRHRIRCSDTPGHR